MSTLPRPSEAVNASVPSQPGFYAIIPASVRYCKELPPAAKLLFGEIVALTSVKGYCYAQNPYFMELYQVDRATIKRWLAALAAQGFVRIEHDRSTNERRIYADAMLPVPVKKPEGGVAHKRATPSAQTRHPQRINAPQSITLNNTKNITSGTRAIFVGPGPVPARELKDQEEKVTASPPTQSSIKITQVERAVARCGDLSYRSRFGELWDSLEQAGRLEVWGKALDAVKAAKGGPAAIVGPLPAYFCQLVASSLSA